MKSTGIFPVSTRILPIWTNAWLVLFVWGIFLFVVPVSVKSCWESKSFELNSLQSAANSACVLGLIILLLTSLWDIILFAAKASSPLQRLSDSIFLEEKIEELQKAKGSVTGVVVTGVFTLITTVIGGLLFAAQKSDSLKGSIVDPLPEFVSTNHRYVVIGFAGLVLVLGLVSFLLKHAFVETWNNCVFSYPQKNMCSFVSDKPGVSRLWFTQTYFCMFIISAFLTFSLAASFWKKSLLGGLVPEDSENTTTSLMTFSNPLYQAMLVCCLLIGLLIVADYFANLIKSKRAIDAAMKKQQLFERDIYEVVKTSKSVVSMMGLQYWSMVIWFFGSLSVVLLNDQILQNMSARGFFQLFSVLAMALITFTVIPMATTQMTIRKNLDICHYISSSKNRHLLELSSHNVDL